MPLASVIMPLPSVVAMESGSPAEAAGVRIGDQLRAVNGEVPRDVIQYQTLIDEAVLCLDIERDGLELQLEVEKPPGTGLGIQVRSALFDYLRTCDNRCEFCFIYQLPPGLRSNLYVKDDDYRLSFLYGNFTTLTRFTEADLERVVTERLSPLYVSIHATDPKVRAEMLRNRRGATSLRWLRALLDHGIEIHGQLVVCPGINDGGILDDTLCGILDEYPDLASVGVVPLGVSRYAGQQRLREHTFDEAVRVVDSVEQWQRVFTSALGKPLVHASDEYYILVRRQFPPMAVYGAFEQHENGVGMARAFEMEFREPLRREVAGGGRIASFDGAPAEGYRPRRSVTERRQFSVKVDSPSAGRPITSLTGESGAPVIAPRGEETGRHDVAVLAVGDDFFGGNIGVTGLLTGHDLKVALRSVPGGRRYLLPDVCLSNGRFLDGKSVEDLPREVEVIPTDGRSLRRALSV